MADDVFDHDDGAFDDHSEIQSSKRKQIGGNMAQVETNRSEEEGKGDGGGNNEGAADVAEKQEEDDRDEDHAFGEVVEDGVAK